MLKWLLRIGLGIIAVGLILFIVLKLTFSEDIPTGISGKPADELALKVLDAINHEEFEKAALISWTFRDKNHYRWRPQEEMVTVSWDDYKVELNTKEPEASQVLKSETVATGATKVKAIAYALENFNNDSFWMVAPHKIMDPGTEREIIKEDAQEKLLVRYTSGGSTPGDVYVWKLDNNYRPQNFQMWVSILPFDGIEAKWEDWEMTDAGFPVSKRKTIFGVEIPISNVEIQ